MAMTVATSRSAGLSTMPSSMTRQPSLTTGKKMNSMMSCKQKTDRVMLRCRSGETTCSSQQLPGYQT